MLFCTVKNPGRKSLLLLVLVVFWLSLFARGAFAQGSCTASYQQNRCNVIANSCDDGYVPVANREYAGPNIFCSCSCLEKGITNPIITGGLAGLSGAEFVSKLISFGISIGFIVAAVVFMFMFLMGGIKWITSAGDKGKVEEARSQLTHAIIGLLLTFMLYVILGIIENFFGISLRSFNLPKLGD